MWLNFNIEQLIRRYALSLINIHCGPGGLFLFKKPSINLIATCHHTFWQQSRYIPSQSWKRIFLPFEKATLRKADTILCVSNDSQRVLTTRYGISTAKTVVIPNGVDTARFHPLEKVQRINHSILFVGRIDKRKGIDYLLGALPVIKQSIHDVKLFVCGQGRDKEKMAAYARSHGLEHHIRFLGFLPDTDLNFWYNRVNCVVVPSVFEGFGLTAVEAMAAGTSVIATDVDGLRDVVDDGTTGYLVPYGDKQALAARVIKLLIDRRQQLFFVLHGLEKVRIQYDWNKIARQASNYLLSSRS